MNSILKPAFLLLSFIFVFYSCTNQEGEGEGEMNEQKIYKTPEEAIAKAKSDLIQVLETNKDLDLGIDVEKLRNAETVEPARYAEVDFDKLLRSENVLSLSDISSPPKSMVAPFVLENTVVGVAEVGEVPDGWKIVGLGNKPITDDLNTAGIMLDKEAAVTIYEVPNLQLFIYGVKKEASETYYLNFSEFTLKDSTNLEAFYPVLRESSIQFYKEFGDQLKKEKLVK
jgi:hypothetical protein